MKKSQGGKEAKWGFGVFLTRDPRTWLAAGEKKMSKLKKNQKEKNEEKKEEAGKTCHFTQQVRH